MFKRISPPRVIKFLKNKLGHLPKFLILSLPVITFFIWVWLLFVKLQKDVVVEIEDLISSNEWVKAIHNIEEILKEGDDPQIHLYVFGSVAKFGLEEEQAKKGERTLSAHKKVRDYNYELIRRDSMGLYLRESFFYRFKKFPRSERIGELLCDYLDYFPDALENEKKLQQIFLKILAPGFNWKKIDTSCRMHLFDPKWSFLKGIRLLPKKKAKGLRLRPNIRSKVIQKVRPKESIFLREEYGVHDGKHRKSDVEHKKWLYAINESGKSGWVLSKDFSSLP